MGPGSLEAADFDLDATVDAAAISAMNVAATKEPTEAELKQLFGADF